MIRPTATMESRSTESRQLFELSKELQDRFVESRQREDIDASIDHGRKALNLLPDICAWRSELMDSLGISLYYRYEQWGEMHDLEDSVVFHRSSLFLRSEGHPDRAISLNNLANSLLTRFEQGGRDKDLEDAIELQRSALDLRPRGHPHRAISLNNLANSLLTRFEQSGRDKDLEDAIELQRSALDLHPQGHPHRAISLNNLANSLSTRFEQSGRDKDLEDAIELQRSALDLRPQGHPHRSMSLNNLANSLSTRFEQSGRDKDLEDAIELQRSAVDLHPQGHPHRSMSLINLVNTLVTRSKQNKGDKDLEDGIWPRRTALDVIPHGHSCNHSTKSSNDFEEAIQLLRSASNHAYSSLRTRLEAANRWSTLARSHGHATTLEAYQICTSLMERALTLRLDLQSQHDLLVQWAGDGTTPCDAASYAIASGNLARAIELLERGRGLIWSQMRGYRTRLDELEGQDKALAIRFGDVSHELERLAISSESHMDTEPTLIMRKESPAYFDEIFARKRRLTMEQENIVEKIREIPGFKDFLGPTAFVTLRKAADEGPVIIINTCKFRSDVLIILPGDVDCACIPLDGKFYTDASDLIDGLLTTRREFKPSSPQYEEKLRCTMRMLWDRVICHVVEKLDEIGIPKGSRIWWCPTSVLTALPFHAAGPFTDADGNEKYFLDDYVSSYTPTLVSLIDARSDYEKGRFKMVVVGDTSLSTSGDEIDVIRSLGMKHTRLVKEDANRELVMKHLQKTRWVHFTCHGRLNSKPFDCSFGLSDGGLTLLDIIKAHIPNAEFAFLSACHSAEQPASSMKDEVLHLAAAIQFCGFRSVIGTMWQLADEDGPTFARDVYSYMGKKVDGIPKFKMAAAALREAVVNLKAQEGVSAERWVNMVHIGA